jgi:hypothetical protein
MRCSLFFPLTKVMPPWYWVLQTATRRLLFSRRTRPTRSLKKDPTDSVERKTVLLLKSAQLPRMFANNCDHMIPGHLDFT